jgi:hypothetical protein
MGDVEHITTALALRSAVRAKIREGASIRPIWSLISSYVPTGVIERIENGKPRFPLELIPYGRRAEFLRALEEL